MESKKQNDKQPFSAEKGKKYTDVFIDFDDTIFDTYNNARIALRELFDYFELNRYFDKLEDFTNPYWDTNIELWTQYAKGEIDRDFLIVERFRRPLACGKGLEPTREYCLEVSDKFLDLNGCQKGILPGARELLDYLHSRYRLHLCSNGFHEVQYKKLRSSDTDRYFNTVILSEDANANKPHKEFFDYALKQSGAKRETTVMIGDNWNTDIMGAQNSGIDAIYFNRWSYAPETAVDNVKTVNRLTDIINIL